MTSRSDALTRQGVPGGSAPSRASTRTLITERDAVIRRTTLPGGLRIVTEAIPGVRSATVGVWAGVGSRHESGSLHGCSHFLEHLLFKGTTERSALDISVALDEVGGEFNAFTTKEYTCFHARVLDADLPLAIDVLGDMMTNATITAEDVEAEREVILDEIAMHDDDPDDVVHNLFAEVVWGSESALGRQIAGTRESIGALSHAQVLRFYRRHYRPDSLVIAVAGNLDHQSVVRQVRTAFDRNGWLDSPPRAASARSARSRFVGGSARRTRPSEQANLVLGMPGLPRGDERRFALGVLDTVLGGGTSSRLFQEVRERRGLAYSVFSFTSSYSGSGLVGVSAGCLPSKLDQVLDTVRLELSRVAADGITADELRRGQGLLRGGLVLGLEDTASRMVRIGKSELLDPDSLLGIDEVLARIDGVTLDDVGSLAAELFSAPEMLAVVGP